MAKKKKAWQLRFSLSGTLAALPISPNLISSVLWRPLTVIMQPNKTFPGDHQYNANFNTEMTQHWFF
jgi:hypothetical protein